MYYQNYEDYMRSVLGYPIEPRNTYETYNFVPYENQTYQISNNYGDEIMELYPEIYRLINPMVCKICDSNTKPITRELLDQMTEEIYTNIETVPEVDTIINVKVNTSKENRESSTKENSLSNTSKNVRSTSNSKVDTKMLRSETEGKETRQFGRNRTLQDLIRILILNRLLGIGRPPRPPHRPPFPPRPPVRPPRPRGEDGYYNDLF